MNQHNQRGRSSSSPHVQVCIGLLSRREPRPSLDSDVGALGVISVGGGGRVPASLFGVVKTVVVLEGAGRGVRGAAGEEGAAQQGEDGAHPAGIEGEAEGHEASLLVSPDGEPDGGHQTAQAWGDRSEVRNHRDETEQDTSQQTHLAKQNGGSQRFSLEKLFPNAKISADRWGIGG